MAAPERFAEPSNSFPLHRGRRPYMAHRDEQVRLEFSVAIGGAADIDRQAKLAGSAENDPKET